MLVSTEEHRVQMSPTVHPNLVVNVEIMDSNYVIGARDGIVVKALCYKPAGRGFDSL